jgi:hypothetical protein
VQAAGIGGAEPLEVVQQCLGRGALRGPCFGFAGRADCAYEATDPNPPVAALGELIGDAETSDGTMTDAGPEMQGATRAASRCVGPALRCPPSRSG